MFARNMKDLVEKIILLKFRSELMQSGSQIQIISGILCILDKFYSFFNLGEYKNIRRIFFTRTVSFPLVFNFC